MTTERYTSEEGNLNQRAGVNKRQETVNKKW